MITSSDRVPFNDLGRMDATELAEVRAAMQRVLDSGWYVMGPEHDAFEAELAAYLGTGEVIAVANGTDALELALAAIGVGSGDTVLMAANAGGYAAAAARVLGAVPVYADVDPHSLLLSAQTVIEALDRLPAPPKAVVVTHLFGTVADVPAVLAVTDPLGIPVVEDCAQSLGAVLGGRRAGSFGAISTTSFYPTKNLGALGDGGAVATSDPERALLVRRMRQYGWTAKYRVGIPHGRNSRLDELQAAILRVRLPRLDAANSRRREIHARYEEAAGASLVTTVAVPYIAHLAVAAVDDRDAARAQLEARGVGTDVHYPVPDHLQAFTGVDADRDVPSLPVTEAAAGRILSLPMFPALTDDEVDRVCRALAEVLT